VLPADLIAHELQVFGFAQVNGVQIENVDDIALIRGDQGKTHLRPLRIGDASDDYRAMLGAKPAGRCLVAAYPLHALAESNTVRITYDLSATKGVRRTRVDTVSFRLRDLR
jgi:hypothetical protein